MQRVRRSWTATLGVFLMLTVFIAGCAQTAAPTQPPAPAPAPAPGAVAPTKPAERLKMSFAAFPALYNIPVFIAKTQGFFEDENLDMNVLDSQNGALHPALLMSGEVNSTTVNMINIAQAHAQNRHMIQVFNVTDKLTMNMVVHNDKLKELGVSPSSSLEDKYKALGKMKIGFTSPNAPTDTFTRFYLRKGGYNPDRDAQMVSIGGATNLIAALRTKQIDAFQLTPPTPNLVELEGFATIFIKASTGEVPELDGYPYTGIAVMKDWADKNEEALTRFVRAMIKASKFAKAEPAKAQQQLKQFFPDMSDAVLASALRDMLPSLPATGALTLKDVTHYFTLNKELKIFEGVTPPLTEGVLWTNKYIDEALKTIK